MRPNQEIDGRSVRIVLLFLFMFSGLAGLIYESIWSHYLRLFLGHAAYAQTLVLCVFMGGLAAGAWIASRYSPGIRNALRAYAFAELMIGATALVSDSLYKGVTGTVFHQILPALESGLLVQSVKWGAGVALLLPQSILLGVTFPLMSSAFLRRYQHAPGVSIGMLYFTNSFGGAVGVLVSGFFLMETVGLPGTLLTGGIISAAGGGAAWLLSNSPQWRSSAVETDASRVSSPLPLPAAMFLLVSLLTGIASFLYEVGWIRMLSLVLGATTHAFELMLSAFILGLALGGWWMRRRIGRLADPVGTLIHVQLAMGVLAVLTLPLYGDAFDAMASLLSVLQRTEGDYAVFLFVSHAIALVVMLPATLCAGMTLPLITHILVAGGQGERSVGRVYAVNTVGAIVGVLAAVHVLMPVIGLESVIVTGGSVDVAAGILLAMLLRDAGHRRMQRLTGVVAAAVIAAIALIADLDPRRMSSGVFRTGSAWLPQDTQVLFQHDGKTATVSVIRQDPDVIAILTNGKSDGSVSLGRSGRRTPDEPTQILLGALPLTLKPDLKTAAVVGLGTGMTSRVILSSPAVEKLDTVEIENGIIRGARYFEPVVTPVFTDGRSEIHLEDAKTFFTNRGERYDLIVSQPSNPWVSGVSSLFTREYYELIRQFLRPEGIFLQWMHVYENDVSLIMSVLKALKTPFPVFDIYQFDSSDIGIVAYAGDRLPAPYSGGLSGETRSLLEDIGIYREEDFESLYLGSSGLLGSLVDSYPIPENSDFFPILDLYAPKARFQQRNATALFRLASEPIPAVEILSGRGMPRNAAKVSPRMEGARAESIRRALTLAGYVDGGNLDGPGSVVSDDLKNAATFVKEPGIDCRDADRVARWFEDARRLSLKVAPFLPRARLERWWRTLDSHACAQKLSEYQMRWLSVLKAIGRRDAPLAGELSEALLAGDSAPMSADDRLYLVKVLLTAKLAQGDAAGAVAGWNYFGGPVAPSLESDLVLRLLVTNAVDRFEAAAGG